MPMPIPPLDFGGVSKPMLTAEEAKNSAEYEASIQEFLDTLGVPTEALANGNMQALTCTGRIGLLANMAADAISRYDAARKAEVNVAASDLMTAKTLLRESFQWLGGFKQAADLRQRVILFMGNK